MPAYDRPIVITVDRPTKPVKHDVAAVIKFSSTDLTRCREYLIKLEAAGIIDHFRIDLYDASFTSPELYFP
jgi:hypothetical protein